MLIRIFEKFIRTEIYENISFVAIHKCRHSVDDIHQLAFFTYTLLCSVFNFHETVVIIRKNYMKHALSLTFPRVGNP